MAYLDQENADRNLYNSGSLVTLLTHTPGETSFYVDITLGDGSKNLNGSGAFLVSISIGGNIVEPDLPAYDIGGTRRKIQLGPYNAAASESVVVSGRSTNTSDTDVDTTCTMWAAASGSGGGATAAEVWDYLTSAISTSGSIGKLLKDNVDAPLSTIDTVVDAIKAKTDNLPSDPADASDIAAAFGTVNTTLGTIAGYVDTEVAAIKTVVDTILLDTAELQTDWADGGRLDVILDARASQASVDDVPTNAELATAISSGLATYDGPTNAEMVAAFTQIKGAGWSSDTDTLEAIAAAGRGAVTVTPIYTTVSAGDVQAHELVVFQNATRRFRFTCVDDANPPQPIVIVGHDVEFRVWKDDAARTLLLELTSDDGEITLGGANDNEATVIVELVNEIPVGAVHNFLLQDVTTGEPLAKGTVTCEENVVT